MTVLEVSLMAAYGRSITHQLRHSLLGALWLEWVHFWSLGWQRPVVHGLMVVSPKKSFPEVLESGWVSWEHRLTRTGIAEDKSRPAEGRVQRKETNVAPRNEGEKRRDRGRVVPMGKALWGPSTPRLLLFKHVLEKVERLSCKTESHTGRCESTDTYLQCLSSRMAFIFLS